MATPGHARHYCPRCGLVQTRGGACDRDRTPLTPVIASSLLGTEVGNYVVVQRLGEGGMGAVYRAIQPSIGAEVAIKVLHATAESQSDAVQRFLLEAQAVNRVRHGNLLRIIDTGYLADRRPYLVMELLDGITLAEAVGKLPYPLACHVAAEALDALHAVHDEGIVHRDLKPANIFLARDGRVVVLDFGIAKLVTPDGNSPATKSGIIGTPEYMAPEQIRSWPIDRRTDVYAMGILLYETVTGRRPFAAAATFDMLVQHLERPPTSPRDWVPTLPNAISSIILTALEKAPERRFQSASAMASALRGSSTATRAELATFVMERAAAPAPIPIQTPPSPDPGQSASGPTQREVGAPTTPGRARRDLPIRETATETVRPSDRALERAPAPIDDDDMSATLAVRPSAARRPVESRPVAERRVSPVIVILVAIGLAATSVVIALLVMRNQTVARVDPPVVAPVVTPAPPPIEKPVTKPVVAPDAGAAIGYLEIDSNPQGAAVFVDGVAVGPSPVKVTLTAGSHKVELRLANYLPVEKTAEVQVNVRSQLLLQLGAKPVPIAKPSIKPIGDGKSTDGRSVVTPNWSAPVPSSDAPPVEDDPSGSMRNPYSEPKSGSGDKRKPNPF